MPKKNSYNLKPGDSIEIRSPLYRQHTEDDIKGTRIKAVITLSANSSVSSYPEYIRQIFNRRKNRIGGLPYKIAQLNNGTWVPIVLIKLKRDPKPIAQVDKKDTSTTDSDEPKEGKIMKKTNSKLTEMKKKNLTVESLKRFIQKEVKNLLKEEKMVKRWEASSYEGGDDEVLFETDMQPTSDFPFWKQKGLTAGSKIKITWLPGDVDEHTDKGIVLGFSKEKALNWNVKAGEIMFYEDESGDYHSVDSNNRNFKLMKTK